MKNVFTHVKKKSVLLGALLSFGLLANAQLKVGDNPTTIQKSSILELESSRQGLLLPRLADTSDINLLSPPDGMIIFLNSDKSLRLRSNGSWKKIADLATASANWSLTGNSGTDTALNFIGTVDDKALILKTNNADRIHIAANGNIGIGTATPSASLDVIGNVKLQSLAAGDASQLEVLVLAADGSVYKRSMSAAAFANAIGAINGISAASFSLTAEASLAKDSVAVESRGTDSTIAIYLPVQNGASGPTKPYGLLTYNDWQKIQTNVQMITIGAVASTPDVNGATIATDSTSRQIILHPADATNPGIVTADTQIFGGDKTFKGNTTLDGTLKLNNVAENGSLDSVLVISNGLVQKRQVSAAAFGNAIRSINNNRDTAQAFSIRNTGSDLSVSANGTDSIYLNIPDAGVASRGVITTTGQTFAGTKNFQDSIIANKSILVGNTGAANSTMQVNGSLSLAIITVTTNYAIAANDNTVLVNTTTGAINVSLPAATNISGRIYTIKKIGTGGIDNQLTITPASGTIDGGTSYIIYNDWTGLTLQTDGSNWFVIKK